MSEVSQEEFDDFKKEVRMALANGNERFNQIVKCQNETCQKLDLLIEQTTPIVELINDAKATGRMADRVQAVSKKLFGWAAIIAGIVAWFELIKLALKNLYDKIP